MTGEELLALILEYGEACAEYARTTYSGQIDDIDAARAARDSALQAVVDAIDSMTDDYEDFSGDKGRKMLQNIAADISDHARKVKTPYAQWMSMRAYLDANPNSFGAHG